MTATEIPNCLLFSVRKMFFSIRGARLNMSGFRHSPVCFCVCLRPRSVCESIPHQVVKAVVVPTVFPSIFAVISF